MWYQATRDYLFRFQSCQFSLDSVPQKKTVDNFSVSFSHFLIKRLRRRVTHYTNVVDIGSVAAPLAAFVSSPSGTCFIQAPTQENIHLPIFDFLTASDSDLRIFGNGGQRSIENALVYKTSRKSQYSPNTNKREICMCSERGVNHREKIYISTSKFPYTIVKSYHSFQKIATISFKKLPIMGRKLPQLPNHKFV